jgi:lipid A 3-O-deacylase
LSNEPAIQIAWDRKFKEYRGNSPVLSGFSTDLIPSAGLRLGNIESSANVGIEARVGWDIPNDFGSITIRPGTDSRPPDIETSRDPNNMDTSLSDAPRFGFHFFTILELKFIGYSFSTDGNLYSSNHSVTREPWNAFGAFGLCFPTIIKKQGYNLSIMQVYQSSDFKEQGAHHAYRAVAVSVEL